jgi:hypothetical protein
MSCALDCARILTTTHRGHAGFCESRLSDESRNLRAQLELELRLSLAYARIPGARSSIPHCENILAPARGNNMANYSSPRMIN